MSTTALNQHSQPIAAAIEEAVGIIESFDKERLFDDIDGSRLKLARSLSDLMKTSGVSLRDMPAFKSGVSDTLAGVDIEPTPHLGEVLSLWQTGRVTGSLLESQQAALRLSARHLPAGATYLSPITYTLDKLVTTSFDYRNPLLFRSDVPILREGDIGEVYAARGIGKTWLLQTIALIAASGREAMGISAWESCRVLYIDGEMASEEVQERFRRLSEMSDIAPPSNLAVIGADWQENFLKPLDTKDGQEAIEPFVAEADLIILDNRSCVFDPEGEKDPSAWQPAQDWLLSLRRRGKATLLGHHANRNGGARGIGKPEDVMNLLLKLTHPNGYTQNQGARFLVEFDKARSIQGSAAAPFVAALTPQGWVVEENGRAEDGAEKRIRDQAEVIRPGVTKILYEAENTPKSRNALEAALRNANLPVGKTATFTAALNALVGECLKMELGPNRSHLYRLTDAAFAGAPVFLGLDQ